MGPTQHTLLKDEYESQVGLLAVSEDGVGPRLQSPPSISFQSKIHLGLDLRLDDPQAYFSPLQKPSSLLVFMSCSLVILPQEKLGIILEIEGRSHRDAESWGPLSYPLLPAAHRFQGFQVVLA